MAKDKISITGIKAFGFHGVLDHERKNGQDFITDIEFTYKTDKAIKTDEIKFAIELWEEINNISAICDSLR